MTVEERRRQRMWASRRFRLHSGWWLLLLLLGMVVVPRLPPPSSNGMHSLVEARPTPTMTTTRSRHRYEEVSKEEKLPPLLSRIAPRVGGILSLLQDRPLMLLDACIRIAVAMALELALDAFLKGVVTPAVTATGIGAAVAPLTFLVGQALQPIVHSIAFLVFDDKFLLATLEATGLDEQLFGKHRLGFFEGFFTRYVVKSCAAWCLGLAGLTTILPFVGHFLTALLTGWVVAWDYVYVPLSNMGHVGPLQQFQTVWQHWGEYQWYGFWAVLIEEIPVLGPACHVYNVYSAAFFLERVYLLQSGGDDATVSTVSSDSFSSFKEL